MSKSSGFESPSGLLAPSLTFGVGPLEDSGSLDLSLEGEGGTLYHLRKIQPT